VAGFASTLSRDDRVSEQPARYVEMIATAAGQLGELIDQLALLARIEGGRFEPSLEHADTLELARAAADRLGVERAAASGGGAIAKVDRDATERALAALALASLRHGSLDRVELEASGLEVAVQPVPREAAPILLGDELRDLGAAAAVMLIEALGGDVRLDGEALRIRLPAA
jgi:signal transduction histidine kinase